MNTIGKIACRTVGTLGMGIALSDAFKLSKHFSKTIEEDVQAKHLQKVYYSSRTIDNVSYNANGIRKKSFDLRTKNPIYAIYGKVKGAVGGFLYGLGNFLPAVALSSLALLCKNWVAAAGAIGVGLGICMKFAREGFGLGKQNPMK